MLNISWSHGPHSKLDVKLGRRRNDHKGQGAIRHYANIVNEPAHTFVSAS